MNINALDKPAGLQDTEPVAPVIFYRYEVVQYASSSYSDEYRFRSLNVELRQYNLWKETPKGYWIGYGYPSNWSGKGKWVSKTSRRRFAYPSKEEALENFIKRSERRMKILTNQLETLKSSIAIALKLR